MLSQLDNGISGVVVVGFSLAYLGLGTLVALGRSCGWIGSC